MVNRLDEALCMLCELHSKGLDLVFAEGRSATLSLSSL